MTGLNYIAGPKINHRRKTGIRFLGTFTGSRGSVLNDILRDHDHIDECDLIIEQLD